MENVFDWIAGNMEYIFAVVMAILSGVISCFLSKKSVKDDLKKAKEENIFQTKRDTIISSLNLIDEYLSWLSFDSGITPERNMELTPAELTMEARKIYNELSNTCEDENVPKLFASILFDDNKNVLEVYSKYRNVCRKEIGLKEIDLDSKKIFISKVSTKDLSNKK